MTCSLLMMSAVSIVIPWYGEEVAWALAWDALAADASYLVSVLACLGDVHSAPVS
jgi:hypothetical protein